MASIACLCNMTSGSPGALCISMPIHVWYGYVRSVCVLACVYLSYHCAVSSLYEHAYAAKWPTPRIIYHCVCVFLPYSTYVVQSFIPLLLCFLHYDPVDILRRQSINCRSILWSGLKRIMEEALAAIQVIVDLYESKFLFIATWVLFNKTRG